MRSPASKFWILAPVVAASVAWAPSAHAVLVSEGVAYTTSYTSLGGSNWELTLVIDATANTFGATALTAVAINPGGSYSNVALAAAPPTFSDWTFHTGGLPAGSSPTCNGSGAPAFFCFDNTAGGSSTASSMTFKFDFTDAGVDLTGPEVKVAWLDTQNGGLYTADGGHHLSVQVPTTPAVPEPGTYASLLAGLGLLAVLRSRRS